MASVVVMVALGIAATTAILIAVVAAMHGSVTSQKKPVVIPPLRPPRFPY